MDPTRRLHIKRYILAVVLSHPRGRSGTPPAHTGPSLLCPAGVRQVLGGNYALIVPVLDLEDSTMVSEIRRLSRRIMGTWFKLHVAAMKQELAELTAMRHGMPFESLFTRIWHKFFGILTRELIQSGFAANPYAPGNPSPESFGTLRRHPMFDFPE